MLSTHGKTAVIALLPLLIWGVWRASEQAPRNEEDGTVEMVVEHAQPAQVHLTRSVGGNVLMVDIANDSAETLYVSIPHAWTRGEVRNVPLASLAADAPGLGYRRWTLPAGAIVTFHPQHDWTHLTVKNAGGTLLHVKITAIDLAQGAAETDAYLVNDSPLSVQF